MLPIALGGCGLLVGDEQNKKIPAEYDLAAQKDKKILVLVRQPGWLQTDTNLRYDVTVAINNYLASKLLIPADNLVTYTQLTNYRSRTPGFNMMSPDQIGRGIGADLVLMAAIDGYQMNKIWKTNYYKGYLSMNAVLIEAGSNTKLWPKQMSKPVKVGFEVEEGGRDVASKRLAAGSAHCLCRYLYDCPEKYFKSSVDRADRAWEQWEQ